MAFHLRHILAVLVLGLAATHAALSPELYWSSVLPSTPMPKVIRDLLRPDLVEDKSTSVKVGKGSVNVDAGKGKPGGTVVNVGKGAVNVNIGKGKPGGTSVNVGKGGVDVNTGRKGKPGTNRLIAGSLELTYSAAATELQLHGDPTVALFFLEKDMRPGKTMTLDFTEITDAATFLPRQVADSIPFSSNKLPEIYNKLSVAPGSTDAETMKKTIELCETPRVKGEEKYCATSLESMIDFATSKLGKNVQAVSTEAEGQTQIKKYTITSGVKKMAGDKAVVCHKLTYAYVVFYCHAIKTTSAYMVPLKGADGTKVNAVAVCHTDTSAWNAKYLAFQVLKVAPGTVPVCHLLPVYQVLWVPNPKLA